MGRWVALGLATATAAAVVGACSAPGAGTRNARIDPGAATVLVSHDRQAFDAVDGARNLSSGDRVRVVRGGGAVLRVPGGSTIELRPESELLVGNVVDLVAGDALLTGGSDSDRPLVVDVGPARARLTAAGVARARRDLTATIGTYRGVTHVGSGGARLDVDELRQVSVPALGLLPARTAPLELDGRDPWDRRLVGDAIELADQLVARSRGFVAQLAPGTADVAGLVRVAFPSLEAPDAAAGRTLADALVAASIASSGRRGTLSARWTDVLASRDEGAAWSVVARDQGVAGDSATARLDDAMGRLDGYTMRARDKARAAQALAPAPSPQSPPSSPSSPPAAVAVPPTGTHPADGPPNEFVSPPASPSAPPPQPGVLDAVDPVVDAIGALLGGLLGALP